MRLRADGPCGSQQWASQPVGLPASSAARAPPGIDAQPTPIHASAPAADVDGTLIHSVGTRSNYLHKASFTAAFKQASRARGGSCPSSHALLGAACLRSKQPRCACATAAQVFGLDTHIDVVKHHGRWALGGHHRYRGRIASAATSDAVDSHLPPCAPNLRPAARTPSSCSRCWCTTACRWSRRRPSCQRCRRPWRSTSRLTSRWDHGEPLPAHVRVHGGPDGHCGGLLRPPILPGADANPDANPPPSCAGAPLPPRVSISLQPQLAGEGLELLPGVLPLLEALAARDDVAVGLVTGNLESIGWGACRASGLATGGGSGVMVACLCQPSCRLVAGYGACAQLVPQRSCALTLAAACMYPAHPPTHPSTPPPTAAKMDALGIRHLFTQLGQPPANFGGFSTGACPC